MRCSLWIMSLCIITCTCFGQKSGGPVSNADCRKWSAVFEFNELSGRLSSVNTSAGAGVRYMIDLCDLHGNDVDLKLVPQLGLTVGEKNAYPSLGVDLCAGHVNGPYLALCLKGRWWGTIGDETGNSVRQGSKTVWQGLFAGLAVGMDYGLLKFELSGQRALQDRSIMYLDESAPGTWKAVKVQSWCFIIAMGVRW